MTPGAMDDQIEALQAAAEGSPAPRRAPADLAPVDGEPWAPRVMVADDDPGFRAMLRDWLGDLGVADVVEAPDGA